MNRDTGLNAHFLFSFTDPDPKVCKDNTKTADCEDWKRAGFCTEHPAMIVHCKKTCGFCSSGKKTIFFAIIPAASKRRRNLYCDYSNRGTSFFFIQTDQLNSRYNYATVENVKTVWTFLTSQEKGLKFMNLIGPLAKKNNIFCFQKTFVIG